MRASSAREEGSGSPQKGRAPHFLRSSELQLLTATKRWHQNCSGEATSLSQGGNEGVISQKTQEMPSKQRVEMVRLVVTCQASLQKSLWHSQIKGKEPSTASLLRQTTWGRKTETHQDPGPRRPSPQGHWAPWRRGFPAKEQKQ